MYTSLFLFVFLCLFLVGSLRKCHIHFSMMMNIEKPTMNDKMHEAISMFEAYPIGWTTLCWYEYRALTDMLSMIVRLHHRVWAETKENRKGGEGDAHIRSARRHNDDRCYERRRMENKNMCKENSHWHSLVFLSYHLRRVGLQKRKKQNRTIVLTTWILSK